jgi:hypothetical protein
MDAQYIDALEDMGVPGSEEVEIGDRIDSSATRISIEDGGVGSSMMRRAMVVMTNTTIVVTKNPIHN